MIFSIIYRKFKTAKNIYEDGGIKHFPRYLKQNFKRFSKNSQFKEINRLVVKDNHRACLPKPLDISPSLPNPTNSPIYPQVVNGTGGRI